jgi:cytochrome P450
MHDKYGPILRVGPNEVSFITSQAWSDICSHNRDFKKDVEFYGRRPVPGYTIVTAPNRVEHSRMRKAFNPGFSEKALREQESLIASYADKMIWRMSENMSNDKSVNLTDIFLFSEFLP